MRDVEKYRLGNEKKKPEDFSSQDHEVLLEKLINVCNDHYVSNTDKPLCGLSHVNAVLEDFTKERSLIRQALLKSYYAGDESMNLEGLFTLF